MGLKKYKNRSSILLLYHEIDPIKSKMNEIFAKTQADEQKNASEISILWGKFKFQLFRRFLMLLENELELRTKLYEILEEKKIKSEAKMDDEMIGLSIEIDEIKEYRDAAFDLIIKFGNIAVSLQPDTKPDLKEIKNLIDEFDKNITRESQLRTRISKSFFSNNKSDGYLAKEELLDFIYLQSKEKKFGKIVGLFNPCSVVIGEITLLKILSGSSDRSSSRINRESICCSIF